ncbi:MAG: hypothetical protein HRU80_02380 [Ignavibacteriales bacterium]|nr:MAG: hypothetical protein HRU80_02380 [Ignavibacteriales bacterium]
MAYYVLAEAAGVMRKILLSVRHMRAEPELPSETAGYLRCVLLFRSG